MDRMTELQKRKLKNMLNTCESMKRTFSQKRDKASANAFNSGSTSSYNTMHKYEAYWYRLFQFLLGINSNYSRTHGVKRK